MEDFEIIRLTIERVGISREVLAQMLDISLNVLNNYLYGKSKLDELRLKNLTTFLSIVEHMETLFSINKNKGE